MADAQTILVIFLSTALAIFLVLGIILLAFLIDIVQRIKRITEKAERLTDKAEEAADMLKQAALPVAIGRIAKVISDVFGKKSGKEKVEE